MRSIDGKFSTDGTKIFNTVSGEEIPETEPCFLLRARDRNALATLFRYAEVCTLDQAKPSHLAMLQETIQKFMLFRNEHPERKQPGITEHIKTSA
ncbi:MAG TPA: hypothetical protein VFO27_04765 [Bryobacteraceae bacterium]|nr:hypothetical protein [Bryobacteraceae bacterium]